MNKHVLCFGLIIAIVSAFFFSSCTPEDETVSVEERIAKFLSDLNGDAERDDIGANLHDTIDDPWMLPATWSATPFEWADQPFDLLSMAYGSNTADGTFKSNDVLYDGEAIHFDLQEDGTDVWYITRVTVGGIQWIPTP